MIIHFPPMSPISAETIPAGSDWGYQLKWDGVRIIAKLNGEDVKLFSKHGRPKEHVYRDVVGTLGTRNLHAILDGEMIVLDAETKRPDFHKILTLEKQRGRLHSPPYAAIYVLFDLLALDGIDMRSAAYEQRHLKLCELFPEPCPNVLVTELYEDGEKLWEWVSDHHWEGIVSKRLSSSYKEGKKHEDWFKKKKRFHAVVDIVGIVLQAGMPKSLLMRYNDRYTGKVSLGLTASDRQLLHQFIQSELHVTSHPPFPLNDELKRDELVWLKHPFLCEVTALEFTSSGVLRHPKIVQFVAN